VVVVILWHVWGIGVEFSVEFYVVRSGLVRLLLGCCIVSVVSVLPVQVGRV
jgi:hypothetical protein